MLITCKISNERRLTVSSSVRRSQWVMHSSALQPPCGVFSTSWGSSVFGRGGHRLLVEGDDAPVTHWSGSTDTPWSLLHQKVVLTVPPPPPTGLYSERAERGEAGRRGCWPAAGSPCAVYAVVFSVVAHGLLGPLFLHSSPAVWGPAEGSRENQAGGEWGVLL